MGKPLAILLVLLALGGVFLIHKVTQENTEASIGCQAAGGILLKDVNSQNVCVANEIIEVP